MMFIGEVSKDSSIDLKVEFFTYILTTDILNDDKFEYEFFNLLYMITEGAPYFDYNNKHCLFKNKEEFLIIKKKTEENDSFFYCSRHIIANYLVGTINFNKKQSFRLNDIHTTYSILLNYLSLQHISHLFEKVNGSDLYCVYEKLLNNKIGGFDLLTFNNINKNTNLYITNSSGYFKELMCTHQLVF